MKRYSHASRSAVALNSARGRKVMEIFAIAPDRLERTPIIQNVAIRTRGITYVTGFSGAGKSTLLRLVQADNPGHVVSAPPERQELPLIDLLGSDVAEAMDMLGWVGLGEAYLYLTPYQALSDGQKVRAQLALALSRRPQLIIADEFLSTLDRVTAKAVAYSFQRVCRKFGIDAIVATAHDDLAEPLAPDQLVRLDLHAEHLIDQRPFGKPSIPEFRDLRLEEGNLDDYRYLSRFHYFEELDFGEEGEFPVEIYAVRYQGRCIGVTVLMAPYPTEWEEMPMFRAINERVRVCMRLIIHPAFRGAGVAKLLMRPALCRIPFIETRSALAMYQPIYLAAGYQAVELPGNRRTERRERLEQALSSAGIGEMSRLHDPGFCESFLAGLTEGQRTELHELSHAVYVEGQVQDSLYYRAVADLPSLTPAEQVELDEIFRYACDEIPTSTLLQETVYFPMQGFAVRHFVASDSKC